MESEDKLIVNVKGDDSKFRKTGRLPKIRLPVEPLVVFFMIAYGLLFSLRVEYLNKRLSQEFNFTTQSTNKSITCDLNQSSEEYHRYLQVQTQSSYWSLYLAVAQAVPALFSANILGALSDIRGRRIAMMFPVVGLALYSVVYALVAIYGWPLYALIPGSILLGICGDFLTLVACSFAYIADTTTEEKRTYRMVILECLTTVSSGSGQVAVGFLVQVSGFPPPYYVIIALMAICIVYIFFLPESLPSKVTPANLEVREKSTRFGALKFVRDIVDLFRPGPNGRCWKIISYNAVLFEFVLIIVSSLSISVLFAAGEPFCWSPVLIGIFNGLQFVLSGVGLVVGGYVIRLCLSDYFVMQFSTLSFALSLLMTAFATNNVMLFSVTAVGSLRMLAMPICRAKMSKLIGPNEQGILFAFSGCIQSIATLLSPVIFNGLYPLTLSISSGFIFVVMATTFILPFILTTALQVADRSSKSKLSSNVDYGHLNASH